MSTDYVLVHGAGEGNWIWDRVREAINRRRSGFAVVHGSHTRSTDTVNHVVAEDLPGHGYRRHEDLASITLEDYVDAVVSWIEEGRLRNVVLVGHSAAGLILPLVAARLTGRIKGLVFLSCLLPNVGDAAEGLRGFIKRLASLETFIPDIGKTAVGSLPPARLFPFLLRALVKMSDKRGVQPLHKALAQPLLCNGMDPGLAGAVISRLTPYPFQPLVTPVAWREPEGIPSTYVVFIKDRVVPARLQRQMLRTLQYPEVVEMDSGHTSGLYLRAEEIADILLRYA